jgi:hypothetical protein
VTALATSVLVLIVVVGLLAGWAFREERRRRAEDQ